MTDQNSLRSPLYDKTNQRIIGGPFYFLGSFPLLLKNKKNKKWQLPEQTDGSSLSLHVGELIRNDFHMSSALIGAFFPFSSQNPGVDVFAPTSAKSVKRAHSCADVYVWWSYTITAAVHVQFKLAHLDVHLSFLVVWHFLKTRHFGCNQEEGKTAELPQEVKR